MSSNYPFVLSDGVATDHHSICRYPFGKKCRVLGKRTMNEYTCLLGRIAEGHKYARNWLQFRESKPGGSPGF